ncbi:hypothetical protein [Bombilactobacillus thymidiniphilus]|uniref:Surface layer protein A domain-containing protein n=1 Tax=Bombilactobacillus thymidiniphilus TaxID=2923363 RepID=A0ABY4PB70_9LACO|nr:hypothetical protein [Bombilactobacillus thymidiniphilus]UQS83008.1 hypothetical protein MOO47_04290 [Bombilactobacillus thymidiniphilus]
MKTQKLRNFIMIVFLFIPTFTETITIPNTNVVQAKTIKHKRKSHKAKSAKKIEIGQVYWNDKSYSCIKLLDKENYAVIKLDSAPQQAFKDGDFSQTYFYTGKYVRNGSTYILHGQTNDVASVSFMDMHQVNKKEYSYSYGPQRGKQSNINIYQKRGIYYSTIYQDGKKNVGAPLIKQSNSIKYVKGSIFPNNYQEFFQQFTYVPDK